MCLVLYGSNEDAPRYFLQKGECVRYFFRSNSVIFLMHFFFFFCSLLCKDDGLNLFTVILLLLHVWILAVLCTHHCSKNEVFIKDFFSKCDQIRRKLRIWSHLLKKSLMENFILCTIDDVTLLKGENNSSSIHKVFTTMN